ncbi:hypothetical protein [Chitinimonas lacunae]|uniref:KTSC domain-containing protein n=1 Tax=Chitinimonas lacunae TaxID=1963018 RepID=A0ABV8MNW9_9NEIS
MERYKNLSGNSGVLEYDMGPESITVQFRNGVYYAYTYRSAGPSKVEQMKKLAVAGKGLASYIGRYAPRLYEAKWK